MEIDNSMYSFINHKSLSHLAIPYFYSINCDIITKAQRECTLHDPKCISDNLFEQFSKCEIDKEVPKPKLKPKVKLNNTKKKKKKYGSFTRKNKK